MVAECDYALSTYFESGHCNAYMKESDDPYERKMWRQETEKLTRFIKHWAPYIKDIACAISGGKFPPMNGLFVAMFFPPVLIIALKS